MNAPGLVEVIIDIVVRYYSLPDSIITNPGLFFILHFWSFLCYFLNIRWKLSTIFNPQMNWQTKRQNSTMKAYIWAFINFRQNDWAWFFFMLKFTYNNAKNASTGHTLFELNCGYYPCISYEEDLDLRSKSKTAEELSSKLW